MSAVVSNTREGRAISHAALEGTERLTVSEPPARVMIDLHAVAALDAAGIAAQLEARRVLEAQTGGTRILRANDLVCRALKETGTIAAFALWNGPGM